MSRVHKHQHKKMRKHGAVSFLFTLMLVFLSIAACGRVEQGMPPGFTLMEADHVDFERNPAMTEKYDSVLTEINMRTSDNTLDPYAWVDEQSEIVDTILETRGELRTNDVEASALEVAERFIKKMPRKNKIYDLHVVKESVLRSYK